MDLTDKNQEQTNQTNTQEKTISLAEILSSVNENCLTENLTDTNIENLCQDGTNINSQNTYSIESVEMGHEQNGLNTQVQLLTNNIDRRIGEYLLNELEKKQIYINELEEALKFQEKEISELKAKLDAFDKLELLGKIKSNVETKLTQAETNLANNNSENFKLHQNDKPKVVQVKKSHIVSEEEQTQYPKFNPDLVFKSDPGTKVKSISKEEEEPRYNGVMMLDKPKNEPVIKIQLDYDTETGENSSTMSDVLKQRRRARRL